MTKTFPGENPKWKLADIVYILLAIIVFSLASGYFLNLIEDVFMKFLMATFFQASVLILGVFIFSLGRGSTVKELGLNTDNVIPNIMKGIVGGLILLGIIMIVGVILQLIYPQEPPPQPFENVVRSADGLNSLIIIFFIGSVLAPLSEELFFRGFVYPVLRFKFNIMPAMIISGLFFGIMHFDLFRLLPLTLGGIGLAWLYEKTGSLVTPIVAHACWNFIMTWLIIYAV